MTKITETQSGSKTSVQISGMDKCAVITTLWAYIAAFPVAKYRTRYDAKVQPHSDAKGNDLGFVTFLIRETVVNPALNVKVIETRDGWKVKASLTGETFEEVTAAVAEYFGRYPAAGYGTTGSTVSAVGTHGNLTFAARIERARSCD